MNRALLRRLIGDSFGLLALLTGATLATELAFMAVLREFSQQDHVVWMRVEFVQRMLRALLGAELTPDTSATGLMALGFTHPLIYAFSWSYLLTAATRIPAAEIERGTADLLLTLPVARTTVYASATVHLLAACLVFAAAALGGVWLAEHIVPLWEPLEFGRLTIVAVNLLAVHVCVSITALMVSTWCVRRGAAVAIMLAWVFASLLLELLGQLSTTAATFGALGILHYHRPLITIRSGDWPLGHLVVLFLAAIAGWTIGAARFKRRDIPAAG
ncbi:MAG: hypothetical protein H6816_15430 [Phycisphaerales bacterium]|nr:hypothetical protein [Phycisphaerales bacterium]